MIIRQISIFLENRSGRIYDIVNMLGAEKINIHALSMADAADFGVMRLIVDDVDKAVQCLNLNDVSFKLTSVIAVEVPDRPGGLAQIMQKCAAANINVEYMYSMPGRKENCATMIIRTENTDKTIATLEEHGLVIYNTENLT
jgi:hypothetical protein